ncbi:MAG TPA: hypothetical protein VGC88_05025 [Terriglobales bacterium]|jgi:tetratricopeptide (TPR) repeat protein
MLSLILALALSPATTRQTQADLEARVRANSSDAGAHFALCRTYYALENWDGAIEQCQSAVEISGGSQHHDWLGRAYGAKAEHSSWLQAVSLAKKTRTEFEKAVAADPKNAEARRDLAEFYIEAPGIVGGGKDKGLAQADVLDGISRSDADYIRARAAELAKDNAQAEELYKKSVADAKDPANYLNELAGFYRRTERFPEMEQAIGRIALTRNSATPYFDAASTLVRTGRNLPGAIDMLKKFVASGGTDDAPLYQAYYQLGLAYQKLGDQRNAATQFRASAQLADYQPAQKALEKIR